jgi:hypothetical protein
LKFYPPPIKRVDGFVDQAAFEQLVGNRCDKRATEMKMACKAVDIDVALLGFQMPDRNQSRVLDADQTYPRSVSGTYGFVPCQKSKQAVDQTPEVTV